MLDIACVWQVPRLVNTLSLLQRHAPSMPRSGPQCALLQHFPHGFGSLRTIRPSMGSPAPGWGTPQQEQVGLKVLSLGWLSDM